MSEALLIALLTPIAATFATILLNIVNGLLKKREKIRSEEELRENKLRLKDEEIARLKQERDEAKMQYIDLLQQFYSAKLLLAKEIGDESMIQVSALGKAPHERKKEQQLRENGKIQ